MSKALFVASHAPFTARESPTQKPHITISITIIEFFIVELVARRLTFAPLVDFLCSIGGAVALLRWMME